MPTFTNVSVPATYSRQSYSKVVSLAHRNLLHCHVENNEPFRRRMERMSYRNFTLSWIRFLPRWSRRFWITCSFAFVERVVVRKEIQNVFSRANRTRRGVCIRYMYVQCDRAWRRQDNVYMFTWMYLRTDAVLEVKLSESCARSREQIEAARSFTWQWSPAGDSASH